MYSRKDKALAGCGLASGLDAFIVDTSVKKDIVALLRELGTTMSSAGRIGGHDQSQTM